MTTEKSLYRSRLEVAQIRLAELSAAYTIHCNLTMQAKQNLADPISLEIVEEMRAITLEIITERYKPANFRHTAST